MSVVPGGKHEEGKPSVPVPRRVSLVESLTSSRRGSYAMPKEYFSFQLLGQKVSCEKTLDPFGIYHQVLVDAGGKQKRLCENSCFIFPIRSKFRLFTIWMVEWKWFQR